MTTETITSQLTSIDLAKSLNLQPKGARRVLRNIEKKLPAKTPQKTRKLFTSPYAWTPEEFEKVETKAIDFNTRKCPSDCLSADPSSECTCHCAGACHAAKKCSC